VEPKVRSVVNGYDGTERILAVVVEIETPGTGVHVYPAGHLDTRSEFRYSVVEAEGANMAARAVGETGLPPPLEMVPPAELELLEDDCGAVGVT
jgi:hypothetical protein